MRRPRGLLWIAAAVFVLAAAALGILVWAHTTPPIATARPSRGPDATVSPVLKRSAQSIVQVVGIAPGCQRSLHGAGFVHAPERVLTPAHIVAGTRGNLKVTTQDAVRRRAIVVVYDPRRDLAVLYVPGLAAPSLEFDPTGAGGSGIVVAGFEKSTASLTSRPGTIRVEQPAEGPDIYFQNRVTRRIYVVDADFGSLITGGPLLATDGRVYGMVFASALDDLNSGYALTASEISAPADTGRTRTKAVPTQGCAR